MLANTSITQIMTKNVVSLEQKSSLFEAEDLFKKHNIRHLPVQFYGKLVGILSLTDLQRVSFASLAGDAESNTDNVLFDMFNVENIMAHQPVSLQVNQSVKDAAEVLAKKEFHALPVLDGTDLVGIVTTTDLVKFMLEQMK